MASNNQKDCISPNSGAPFDKWSNTTPAQLQASLDAINRKSFSELKEASSRGSILLSIANLIEKNRKDFEGLIVTEVGKTQAEAISEIDYSKSFLTYMANAISSLELTEQIEPNRKVTTVPRGIGLLITPFNDPLAGITRKIANCIGSGAGAIIKPPELGIKTATKLEEILKQEKLDHILSFVRTGDRNLIQQLMAADEIGTISFTGSTEVGVLLSTNAGRNLKPFVGELGGINPFVIFSDADVSKAVDDLVVRKVKAAGQACSAQNILFVEKKVADYAIQKIEDAFSKIKASATDSVAEAKMGPVRTKKALETLYMFEEKLIRAGATCVAGSQNRTKGPGFMYDPTAFLISEPNLFLEYEIFAPLLGICVFEDREKLRETIRSNKQPLVLYAYSSDEHYLKEFISGLNYGSIGLNDTGIQGAHAPTGGFRQAGLGREGGTWGLSEFTTTINVKEVSSTE
jgi:succinate-semialdehyde dehydrogenase/glutarate-semialdehyde dehydrogenase